MRASGFTLIELLVVLAIIAGLTGLAWPGLTKMLETSRHHDERGRVVAMLNALPFMVYSQGKSISLNGEMGVEKLRDLLAPPPVRAQVALPASPFGLKPASAVLDKPMEPSAGKPPAVAVPAGPPLPAVLSGFPEGWKLRFKKPVRYQFNGICTGGEVILLAPDGSTEAIPLVAPRCLVAAE